MPIPAITVDEFVAQVLSFLPVNRFSTEARRPGGGVYALLQGTVNGDNTLYNKLLNVQARQRITTATGTDLDAAVANYFGTSLPRFGGETDAAYMARALSRLFLPVGTRAGMQDGLNRVFTTDPLLTESGQQLDTGGWASSQVQPAMDVEANFLRTGTAAQPDGTVKNANFPRFETVDSATGVLVESGETNLMPNPAAPTPTTLTGLTVNGDYALSYYPVAGQTASVAIDHKYVEDTQADFSTGILQGTIANLAGTVSINWLADPSFSRASVAYLSDGTQVASGSPRFEPLLRNVNVDFTNGIITGPASVVNGTLAMTGDATFTRASVADDPYTGAEVPSGIPRYPTQYTYLATSFTMLTLTNSYQYVSLLGVPKYVIQSGDYLEFDIYWEQSAESTGVDIGFLGGTALRGYVVVDQNGYGSHPATAIPDSYILNTWYSRSMSLAPCVGLTAAIYDIACENNNAGTYLAKIRNFRIVNSGVTTLVVLPTNFTSVSSTLDTSDGTNNYTFTPAGDVQGVMVEEACTNLLSTQQSSLQDGTTTGFYAYAGTTIAATLAASWGGQHSLLQTITTAGDGGLKPIGSFVVTPGLPYTFQCQAQLSAGSTPVQMVIFWYDSAGVYISTSNGAVILPALGTFGPATVTGTAPANAANCSPVVYPGASALVGDAWYFGAFQFTQSAYPLSWQIGGTPRAAESLTIPTAGVLSPSAGCVAVAFYAAGAILTAPAWVGYLFMMGDAGDKNDCALWYNTVDGLHLYVSDGAGTAGTYLTSPASVSSGKHVMLVTWDSSEMIVTLDGVDIATQAAPVLMSAVPALLYLGSTNAGASQVDCPLVGVRIGTAKLSPAERAAITPATGLPASITGQTYAADYNGTLDYTATGTFTSNWYDTKSQNLKVVWDAPQVTETTHGNTVTHEYSRATTTNQSDATAFSTALEGTQGNYIQTQITLNKVAGNADPVVESVTLAPNVVGREVTTNLLTSNQASIETDTSGFGVTSGPEILTRDTSTAWRGTASLLCTTTASSNAQGPFVSINATNGETYTFSVYVKGTGDLLLLGATGACATAYVASQTVLGEWLRFNLTVLATATGNVYFKVITDLAVATTFWVDGLQVEQRAYATAFVDGSRAMPEAMWVEEGTTNLLTANQSSVETDTSGFSLSGAVAIVRDTSVAWQGAASLKVTTPGSVVNEGVYVLAGVPGPATFSAQVRVRGSGDISVSLSDEIAGGTSKTVTLTDEWQCVELTHTASSSSTEQGLAITTLTVRATTFWVDGLQIEQNAHATSWQIGGTPRVAEGATLPAAGNINLNGFTAVIRAYVSGEKIGTAAMSRDYLLLDDSYSGTTNRIQMGKLAAGTWFVSTGEANTYYINVTSTQALNEGWHTFGLRLTSGELSLWIDGAKSGTPVLTPPMPAALPANINFGSDYSAATRWWNDTIDSIDIFLDALTDAQMAQYTDPTYDIPLTYQHSYKMNLDGVLNHYQGGYRVSPVIALDNLVTIAGSDITWTDTIPTDTTVNVSVSTDNGTTWTQAQSGQVIPNLTANTPATGKELLVRQEFTTQGATAPDIDNITLTVGQVPGATETHIQPATNMLVVTPTEVDHWQLEQGKVATTYTASNRAAEQLTIPAAKILSATSGAVVMRLHILADLLKNPPLDYHTWFDHGDAVNPFGNRIQLAVYNGGAGTPRFAAETRDGSGNTSTAYVDQDVTAGWHVVAVRWEATELSLWIDGVKVGTPIVNPHLPALIYTYAEIGRDMSGNNYAEHPIDWIYCYSHAPTDAEMLAMGQGTFTPAKAWTYGCMFEETIATNRETRVVVEPVGPWAWGKSGKFAVPDTFPYQAFITVQQLEPTAPGFLNYQQIMDLITSLKPYGTTMWVEVLGPASTGGVPVH